NTTVTQMDQVTQQNAALVEEAAASAKSLEDQAGALTRSVSVFKLAGDAVATPAKALGGIVMNLPVSPSAARPASLSPTKSLKAAAAGTPIHRAGANGTHANGDANKWMEF